MAFNVSPPISFVQSIFHFVLLFIHESEELWTESRPSALPSISPRFFTNRLHDAMSIPLHQLQAVTSTVCTPHLDSTFLYWLNSPTFLLFPTLTHLSHIRENNEQHRHDTSTNSSSPTSTPSTPTAQRQHHQHQQLSTNTTSTNTTSTNSSAPQTPPPNSTSIHTPSTPTQTNTTSTTTTNTCLLYTSPSPRD